LLLVGENPNQAIANLLKIPAIDSCSCGSRGTHKLALLPMDSLNQLLQHAPIGILYESLDGGILRANTTFCRLIGYSETELRRLDYRAISYPSDLALELNSLQKLIQGQQREITLNKRFLSQDGSVIWTEVKLALVGKPEAEDSYVLIFVTDLSDHQRAVEEIRQRREREALLSEISAQIRTTFDFLAIVQLAVARLQQTLGADRVLAYQLLPDQSGTCIAEAVNQPYPSMLGQSFPAECIPPPYLEAYRLGKLWYVANVEQEPLADCHRAMLKQVHTRSMIAVSIQHTQEALDPQTRSLWGLLVVHHCRAPRHWTIDEQQLVQAVADQVAIALEQASLLHQLQTYAEELEDRVNQRTRSLERSLQFEQLIRNLTETLRKGLDEDQVLNAAVTGLVETLAVDGCYASLFHAQQQVLEVRAEHCQPPLAQTLMGQSFSLHNWPPQCRQQLLAGNVCLHEVSLTSLSDLPLPVTFWSDRAQPEQRIPHGTVIAQLISPILDDQGLIGALCLYHTQSRHFEPAEIKLIEQVANQCAIALRQAYLYQQEHQQRASAEHFRLFLEKSIDIFVEYDQEQRYIAINPAGVMLLGYPLSEILGKTNQELLGPFAQEVDHLIQQAFKTGEPVFVDHEFSLPSGSRLFETIYTPIADPAGVVQRVVGVCRDITEFRRQWQLLETQNHQLAETTRLKEEFIATTSHELRTPLTAILGFSNVLLQEFFGVLNSKQKDYIERIHSSGQHLLDLINDILDLSRLEADRLELELQHIFINDVCEGAISFIQERAENQNLSLEMDIEPELEYVVADPKRLKQMLLNLLTNAVKFTPAGAVGMKVYRSCEHRRDGIPDTVNFLVWDTGIGITAADQALLFMPFSQIDSSLSRQHQGTGLGLVITRKLAELHGGSITLDSEGGHGSRFILSLPLDQASQPLMGWNYTAVHSIG
jgi:PAS domain S-box-containing protein